MNYNKASTINDFANTIMVDHSKKNEIVQKRASSKDQSKKSIKTIGQRRKLLTQRDAEIAKWKQASSIMYVTMAKLIQSDQDTVIKRESSNNMIN